MRPQPIISLLFCCLAGTAGAAATTNLPVRLITLKECISLALDHNLDVRIKRLSTEAAGYRMRAAYGAYDPVVTLEATRTFADQPAEVDPKDDNDDLPYERAYNSIKPSLSGALPWGMTYELSSVGQYVQVNKYGVAEEYARRFLPPFQPFTNYYRANLGLNLRQPLLKNFLIDLHRRDIQLSKNSLKISEAALRAELMTNITEVQTAYYDLILQRELVKVERKALELARQLFDQTQKRVQAGDLAPLSEKQAESHVETVQTALFTVEQDLAAQENTLKLKFTDDFRSWADIRLEPAETLLPVEQPIDRQESWVRAMVNRPDLVRMRLELEQAGIIVRFEQNQLLPSLDVVGGFGWQAVDASLGSAYSDVVKGEHPVYSAGVVFSIPLGNVSARNNLKAAKVERQQATFRLRKREDSIMAEVDTTLKDIESLFNRIGSTRKARLYAEQALEVETKKLAEGVTTSFVVQRHQRDLVTAQSAELKAIAAYQKAIATLALQEGTTLQKNQIEVRVK